MIKYIELAKVHKTKRANSSGKNFPLMGEGFILLTRGYGYMGRVYPPFDTLKMYFCL